MISTIEEIHYWPVRDIDYAPYFQEVQPNGKTKKEKEREKFIAIIDDVVSRYISGFPMIKQELERISDINDDYHILSRVVNSMSLFVLMTMTDMMIASKYFLKADKDYERRYMRGKLRVLQNEGFKKLYGFKDKNAEFTPGEDMPVVMVVGKVLKAPEVYTDERGKVTNAYQDELEKAWIEELRAKHTVVINHEVLDKLKIEN